MNVDKLSVEELRYRSSQCTKDIEFLTPSEKQDRLSEAKFFFAEIDRREQAEERKHTRRIERRDLILELAIIALISYEIYAAHSEGRAQLDAFNKLQTSSDITAQTLKGVREAQDRTTGAIQPQAALLARTRDTLANQLDVAKRQQTLISRQLTIQESIIAAQQRRPVVELRAYTLTKKVHGEYRLMQPGVSSYLGYAPHVLDNQREHEIRFTFLIRNVGTAPILNISPHLRVPGPLKIKCIDFGSEMHLLGETMEECSPPIAEFPPVEPVGKETAVPTPQQSIGTADFVFQAVVVGPTNKPQFDISVEVSGDNLRPIYYRIQCMRLNDMSPYVE